MRYLIPALACMFITSCAPQQTMVMNTTKSNEVVKQYKTLLITGEGNMQAKMYFQNVNDKLVTALAKKNIQAHYEYLGDYNKINTENALKRLNSSQYDAVIRMMPKELAEKRYMINQNGALLRGNKMFKSPKKWSATRLVNDIDIAIIENPENIIWQANLRTFIKPTSRTIYYEIRDKLITTMAENNIIPFP